MCSVNTMSMTNRIETETLNILLFRTQPKIRYDSDDYIDHARNELYFYNYSHDGFSGHSRHKRDGSGT